MNSFFFKIIKDEKNEHTLIHRYKGGNNLQEIAIKVAWSGHVSTGTGRASSPRKLMISAPPHRGQLYEVNSSLTSTPKSSSKNATHCNL